MNFFGGLPRSRKHQFRIRIARTLAMKSWVIGILTISALGGLGWLGYSWTQRGSSAEISGPDFVKAQSTRKPRGWSKAVRICGQPARNRKRWGGQNAGGSASAGDRSTSDPFQRVRQTGAVENTGYETSSTAGGDNFGRYGGEPRKLAVDSNAAPLAPIKHRVIARAAPTISPRRTKSA